MSQVYVRPRSHTQKTLVNKAPAVDAEAARVAHDEKIVPKSYRFTFGVPMCELCLSMIQNIERGDACFPNTSWGVIERKKYMALAMADANALADVLTCLIEVRKGPRKQDEEQRSNAAGGVNVRHLEKLLTLVNEEIGLLHAAKNGVKLIGKATEEERLQATEEEVQRLRDLITIRDGVRL